MELYQAASIISIIFSIIALILIAILAKFNWNYSKLGSFITLSIGLLPIGLILLMLHVLGVY
jgi:hypothetical protein